MVVSAERVPPIPTVLAVRVSPLLKVRADSLELNVFQSVDESHPLAVALDCTIAFCFAAKVVQSVPVRRPVAVDDALAMEIATLGQTVELAPPVIVIDGLAVVKEPNMRAACLLLKVLQSVVESAPVVVELAVEMPNTPVVLLYVSGPRAESAVSPILVASAPERVEILVS
jgi:hypothetical protein